MEILHKTILFIKNLDDKESKKYFLIFLGSFLLLLTLFFYVHSRKINKYTTKLQQINKERNITKKILSDYQLVSQQKNKVEEILSQNKNFFIAQAYNNILQKLKLTSHQHEEPSQAQGSTISDKTERILTAHLDAISMKNLTDLLLAIAENERLYPKELTIKKTSNAKAIDIALTIATLEST